MTVRINDLHVIETLVKRTTVQRKRGCAIQRALCRHRRRHMNDWVAPYQYQTPCRVRITHVVTGPSASMLSLVVWHDRASALTARERGGPRPRPASGAMVGPWRDRVPWPRGRWGAARRPARWRPPPGLASRHNMRCFRQRISEFALRAQVY